MNSLITLYKKSSDEIPSDEEYEKAARILYGSVVYTALSSLGVISPNPLEVRVVCHLKNIQPPPSTREKDKSFSDYLEEHFKKETGKVWDKDKYVLVKVPHQIIGSTHYVVFE